ncbi:MAG: sulfotransferase [Gammaproteobacteria bacterium]|nr:sulfotransferase [Gammaproteobacteria bacterium]
MENGGTGEVDRKANWQAPRRPEWLAALNAEGENLDLQAVVPLDEQSLLAAAREGTGLSDFGEGYWREPFAILCRDLNDSAELNLMGRLMARSDVLIWLQNRLQVAELLKRHPEIQDQEIARPLFIVGLPRSGTSILFEVLSQDPAFGVPQTWEAMFPTPPPQAETYTTDPRIERAHNLVTQWNRVVPEFATMHEMGGRIPAECGMLMANSFISDHIVSLQQGLEYAAWYASADLTPAYEYHRTLLQILQWKNPRQHWLLKAPAHQNYLDVLLKVYPDARIIQTHRDPIKCMASATNMMGCLYYMRSDKAFDADAFEDFMQGEATARRLEHVMQQRHSGVVPAQNICDSRYQDLMQSPLSCVEHIYAHFDMPLTDMARDRMQGYLAAKPKGKFGAHRYAINDAEKAERKFFQNYQRAYQVPDEA